MRSFQLAQQIVTALDQCFPWVRRSVDCQVSIKPCSAMARVPSWSLAVAGQDRTAVLSVTLGLRRKADRLHAREFELARSPHRRWPDLSETLCGREVAIRQGPQAILLWALASRPGPAVGEKHKFIRQPLGIDGRITVFRHPFLAHFMALVLRIADSFEGVDVADWTTTSSEAAPNASRRRG